MNKAADRGVRTTDMWSALCKDCAREARSSRDPRFEYAGAAARRFDELGFSRSDRCPACRKAHRRNISHLSVAYVDLDVISEVSDRQNPTGPLGGLGPLPPDHELTSHQTNMSDAEFGMIDKDIVELLDGLLTHQVAILEAGTGTGKSTFAPFSLMNPPNRREAFAGHQAPAGMDLDAPVLRLNDRGTIVITQPRRDAATGIARFVGEALCFGHDPDTCSDHVGPGYPVGYQVSGEALHDEGCQLIYVTDGTLINWINAGRLHTIGCVIIDEAHERSENIDLILAQLKQALPEHRDLRVIIASATLDVDFFTHYFGGPQAVFHKLVPPYKVVGYGQPLFAGASTVDLTAWSAEPVAGEDLRSTTSELVKLASPHIDDETTWRQVMPQRVAEQVERLVSGTSHGDILAFLPTVGLINAACDLIEAKRLPIRLFRLAGKVGDDEKKNAQAPTSPGSPRKVVVSSNLAETSLTIKGVRYVIDSGLICRSEWDPNLGVVEFPTIVHSKSGVRQRWGRVGRDAPGWVFPLYTREQFERMPKNTPPEASRKNLEQMMLKAVAGGIDIESFVLPGEFAPNSSAGVPLDAADERSREIHLQERHRSIEALRRNGTLAEDCLLTSLGREIAGGSDAGIAVAIAYADQLAVVPEVAVAISLLHRTTGAGGRSQQAELFGPSGLFAFDSEWALDMQAGALRRHRALAVGSVDDLDLVLRVFSLWAESGDDRARAKWAQQWAVRDSVLRAAERSIADHLRSLSPKMRKSAERRIALSLAPRARAVLSRAFASIRYAPSDQPDVYVSRGPDHTIAKRELGSLTHPSGDVLAFQRRRVARNLPVSTAIGGLVAALPWAARHDVTAFDLVVAARAESTEPPDERLTAVYRQFPVGATIRFSSPGAQHAEAEAELVRAPTAITARTVGRAHDGHPEDSGLADGDSGYTHPASIVPDEERLLEPGADAYDLEPDSLRPPSDARAFSLAPLTIRFGSPPSQGGASDSLEIVAYEFDGTAVTIVSEPVASGSAAPVDPGRITVPIRIVDRLQHADGHLIVGVNDSLGRVVMDQTELHVDGGVRTLDESLAVGTVHEAVLVPSGHGRTASLLPARAQRLERQRTDKGFRAADVIGYDGFRVLARIDTGDPSAPSIVAIRERDFSNPPGIGTRLRLRVQAPFQRARPELSVSKEASTPELLALAEQAHLGATELAGGGHRLSPRRFGGFEGDLLDRLLQAASGDPTERARVWRFWLDCYRVLPRDVEVVALVQPSAPAISPDPVPAIAAPPPRAQARPAAPSAAEFGHATTPAAGFLDRWWDPLPRPDEPDGGPLLDWWSQFAYAAEPEELDDWWSELAETATSQTDPVDHWWGDNQAASSDPDAPLDRWWDS